MKRFIHSEIIWFCFKKLQLNKRISSLSTHFIFTKPNTFSCQN